ncbi:MAG TPA: glycosyltransferase [Thermoleophilaceae bacterium]|nr:glycosyltransferase [Thermoleophilaceae bacterium]
MTATPTISVAMPAYQAERWIEATLQSVLAQTSPPHEVVVVDDGSTDGTADVARAFGAPVRVVSQPNGGASAAYNRAFRETEGTYVAMCPADDLWEPRKLELQVEALRKWPEIDVAFGGARYFGLEQRGHIGPTQAGILDPKVFFPDMFRADLIPAPTAVVRRRLFDDLGGFREDLACEDYEFWMRALRRGAVFFHDPRVLVHLRQHGDNLSAQAVSMWEMNHQIHSLYAPDLDDERLARSTLAHDLRTIGRSRLGLGQVGAARQAYRASLGHVPHPAALAWTAVLSLPGAGGPLRRLAARRRTRTTTP